MIANHRVSENLSVVDAHFRSEAANRIEPVLDLYTDNVVWEAPSRQIVLQGKSAAAENYRKMFSSMSDLHTEPIRRFATDDQVVDESTLRFRLTGDGLVNAPVPRGADVQMKVVHIFDMQDGRIARESVLEMWPPEIARPRASAAPPIAAAPTPDRIMQLGLGFWSAKVLLSAVELGVFTALARGPMRGTTLAGQLGLHPRSGRDFLDSLVSLGMLDRFGDTYQNSPDVDFLLDRRKSSYIGGMLEMANERLYRYWGSLTDALRTGMPQNEIKDGSSSLFERLYSDPNRLKNFLQAMTGISMGSAIAIAEKFPWKRYRTFVDVGAAQGAIPVQLALAHGHLTGGGFDLPVVAPLFNEYVSSFGLSDRVKFHAGDFFSDPLPEADVLIMGHILHDWNLAEKRALISKVYRTLPPGGAFIVHEALIDDERRENAFGLLMSLNMLIETPGGFDYTGADCSRWMREAGFRETYVEHLVGPDSMVVGIK
jgi:SAM-dependent methyltransferase